MIKAIIFDWGDTVMRDFPEQDGPMAEWEKVELIPGVEGVLKSLSQKYLCVIATNAGVSDTEKMRKALARVDVEKYFQHFTSSKDLGVEKPDPEFFRKIASYLGMRENECIHIGNLYNKDIVGAKQAGLFTVLFNEKKISGVFPDADAVITTMDTLPEQIKSIELSCQ